MRGKLVNPQSLICLTGCARFFISIQIGIFTFTFQRQGQQYIGKLQMFLGLITAQQGRAAGCLCSLSSPPQSWAAGDTWDSPSAHVLARKFWCELSGCSVYKRGFSPAGGGKKKWLVVTLVTASCENCRKCQREASRSSQCVSIGASRVTCRYITAIMTPNTYADE